MKKVKLTNTDKVALVDNEDYPVVSRLNWYVSDTGYVITDSPVKHLKLHKLLTGPLGRKHVIDHIDRNKLNNQKKNLRIVSQATNSRNTARVDNAKYYYYSSKKGWVVDVKALGARHIQVPNPRIAERLVKRLRLGFPKQIAVQEAHTPTISISNWGKNNVTYADYLDAIKAGISIEELRRISKRQA